MNNDPKFIPLHMRARMHSYSHAHCGNCCFMIKNDANHPWCEKFETDPYPDIGIIGECLCDQYEPGKEVYSHRGDRA